MKKMSVAVAAVMLSVATSFAQNIDWNAPSASIKLIKAGAQAPAAGQAAPQVDPEEQAEKDAEKFEALLGWIQAGGTVVKADLEWGQAFFQGWIQKNTSDEVYTKMAAEMTARYRSQVESLAKECSKPDTDKSEEVVYAKQQCSRLQQQFGVNPTNVDAFTAKYVEKQIASRKERGAQQVKAIQEILAKAKVQ